MLSRKFDSVISLMYNVGEYLTDPFTMTGICVIYLVYVKWLGPKMMATRKPYNLKALIVAYNAFQVIWNFYALTIPLRYPRIFGTFLANCGVESSVKFSNEDWAASHMAWCYYLSKYIDMLDTVFFVLRKKDKQISFLHVYHHTAIVPSCWHYLMHIREPIYLPSTMINTFVHCVMYTYYLLAAMGPEYAKYTWWKIYITRLQLAQFLTVIIIIMTELLYGCKMTKYWAIYLVLSNAFLIMLFGNFYYKAYRNKSKKAID